MENKKIDFTDANMLRRKAEEKLLDKQTNTDEYIDEANIKRLVHELQVHQIELEMQNEELHLAYEIAESALKKYTTLYDLAPMGYFTVNLEGYICDLNFTGAQMLGSRRYSLIRSNFKLFVAEESKDEFNQFFKKVFTSKSKENCEIKLVSDKKNNHLVYMEGIVSLEANQCFLSVVDLSILKK